MSEEPGWEPPELPEGPPESWETSPGQLGVGHVVLRTNVYDGLTDTEAGLLKKELVAIERRRIPLGFYVHERRTT